jgi:hypothetical protein
MSEWVLKEDTEWRLDEGGEWIEKKNCPCKSRYCAFMPNPSMTDSSAAQTIAMLTPRNPARPAFRSAIPKSSIGSIGQTKPKSSPKTAKRQEEQPHQTSVSGDGASDTERVVMKGRCGG